MISFFCAIRVPGGHRACFSEYDLRCHEDKRKSRSLLVLNGFCSCDTMGEIGGVDICRLQEAACDRSGGGKVL